MGRQDAHNVRGHFSKAQRCRSRSSSTVAWQGSVIFYSFILLLIHLHLSQGLFQGSLQREFSICSHWGCLFTIDFLETTEFCQEEHRTQGLSKDRFWNGLFAPSSLSFASHCALCQDVSQQVPLMIATFRQHPASHSVHATKTWAAEILWAKNTS